jgi:YbbR domain-containing protein
VSIFKAPIFREEGPLRRAVAAMRMITQWRPPRNWLAASWQSLRQDSWLRVISLLLAIALWVFVNAAQRQAENILRVPIAYRNLPRGNIIVNQHPEFATIQVSGPRTLLSLIDPSRLQVMIDLSGVEVGETSFKIMTDSFAMPTR